MMNGLLRPASGGLASRCSTLSCEQGSPGIAWLWRLRPAAAHAVAATDAGKARSPKLARVEAALFVSDQPLTERKLVQVALLADLAEAKELIDQLNAAYDQSGSPFRAERLATGYQLLTRPEYVPWLDRIHHRRARPKLSPPMMETLVVIAYRQPITRADIEAVRGVQCAEVIKQLLDRGFIRVVGEDDSLGRAFLYGTTRFFLENFGLKSLDALPMSDRLKRADQPPRDQAEEDLSSAA